ncbi:MAG: carboxymuconolactone decarboxylase family protein [Planctomycetota bacterium]
MSEPTESTPDTPEPRSRRAGLPAVAALGLAGCVGAPQASQGQVHYPRAEQQTFAGPADWFTGDVEVRALFPQTERTAFSGAYVTFQPGARSAWHAHPAGQHLVVTDGVCLTGTRDGTVVAAEVGDAVWCPPEVEHWHGATRARSMTHLVVTGSEGERNVTWLEQVSDADYLAAQPAQPAAVDVDAHLDPRQQALVPIAAFAARGDVERLRPALREGLEAGLTVNELKDALVQLYAYAGFPRALNALGVLLGLVEERRAQGLRDEVGPEATPLPAEADLLALGTQVQTDLVGRPVAGPLFEFAPAIDRYLKTHLFGDVFGSDVLDRPTREFVTVAALSALDGVGSQLRSHLAISLNVGLTREQLQALGAVYAAQVGPPQYDLIP